MQRLRHSPNQNPQRIRQMGRCCYLTSFPLPPEPDGPLSPLLESGDPSLKDARFSLGTGLSIPLARIDITSSARITTTDIDNCVTHFRNLLPTVE